MFLGIDIGTTATKWVLTTPVGQVIDKGFIKNNINIWYEDSKLCGEYNPKKWYLNVVKIIENTQTYRSKCVVLEGVSICGTSPTLIVTDHKLHPTYNAIMWFDERCISVSNMIPLNNIGHNTTLYMKVLWAITNGIAFNNSVIFDSASWVFAKLTGSLVHSKLSEDHTYGIPIEEWANSLKNEGISKNRIPTYNYPTISSHKLTNNLKITSYDLCDNFKNVPVYFPSNDALTSAIGLGLGLNNGIFEVVGSSYVIYFLSSSLIDIQFNDVNVNITKEHFFGDAYLYTIPLGVYGLLNLIDNIKDEEKIVVWESTIVRAGKIARMVKKQIGGKVICYCSGGASKSKFYRKNRKKQHSSNNIEIKFIDNNYSGAFGACIYSAKLMWKDNLSIINQL